MNESDPVGLEFPRELFQVGPDDISLSVHQGIEAEDEVDRSSVTIARDLPSLTWKLRCLSAANLWRQARMQLSPSPRR